MRRTSASEYVDLVVLRHESPACAAEGLLGDRRSRLSGCKGRLHDLGKPMESAQGYRAALEVRQRLLGRRAPQHVSTRQHIAEALCDQGKFAEAVSGRRLRCKRLQQSIEHRARGSEHP